MLAMTKEAVSQIPEPRLLKKVVKKRMFKPVTSKTLMSPC